MSHTLEQRKLSITPRGKSFAPAAAAEKASLSVDGIGIQQAATQYRAPASTRRRLGTVAARRLADTASLDTQTVVRANVALGTEASA